MSLTTNGSNACATVATSAMSRAAKKGGSARRAEVLRERGEPGRSEQSREVIEERQSHQRGEDGHADSLTHLEGAIRKRAASRKFGEIDRKSTRLNSSHLVISYAVFCLKKKR